MIEISVLTYTAAAVPNNGRLVTYPLTDKTIQQFKTVMAPAYIKNELPRQIRPMLSRAGFIYGADLYSKPTYQVTGSRTKITAFLRITFEDTNNEGKAIFTKKVFNTGLLNSGRIVKQYGTI